MKRKVLALSTLFTILVSVAFAASVDTVLTRSLVMKKDIKAVVIKPASYNLNQRFPVVYLLHGYGGNYANWIQKVEHIKEEADRYGMLIVCPDGGVGSWYWDSPIDQAYQYETYIASELVSWVDKEFKTIASASARAITGLSMGGHGALYLAIRHPDVFGAAGSMSGGVDIRPFPNNWEMAKRLGTYAANKQAWEDRTVINLLHLIEPGKLSLVIDCGIQDFFYNVNEQLHAALVYRNISHDYITRPGAHNWEYWTNAVRYQLLFMHRYFEQGKAATAK